MFPDRKKKDFIIALRAFIFHLISDMSSSCRRIIWRLRYTSCPGVGFAGKAPLVEHEIVKRFEVSFEIISYLFKSVKDFCFYLTVGLVFEKEKLLYLHASGFKSLSDLKGYICHLVIVIFNNEVAAIIVNLSQSVYLSRFCDV